MVYFAVGSFNLNFGKDYCFSLSVFMFRMRLMLLFTNLEVIEPNKVCPKN